MVAGKERCRNFYKNESRKVQKVRYRRRQMPKPHAATVVARAWPSCCLWSALGKPNKRAQRPLLAHSVSLTFNQLTLPSSRSLCRLPSFYRLPAVVAAGRTLLVSSLVARHWLPVRRRFLTKASFLPSLWIDRKRGTPKVAGNIFGPGKKK